MATVVTLSASGRNHRTGSGVTGGGGDKVDLTIIGAIDGSLTTGRRFLSLVDGFLPKLKFCSSELNSRVDH